MLDPPLGARASKRPWGRGSLQCDCKIALLFMHKLFKFFPSSTTRHSLIVVGSYERNVHVLEVEVTITVTYQI